MIYLCFAKMLVSVVKHLSFNKPVLFGLETDNLSFCQGFQLAVISIEHLFFCLFIFFPSKGAFRLLEDLSFTFSLLSLQIRQILSEVKASQVLTPVLVTHLYSLC